MPSNLTKLLLGLGFLLPMSMAHAATITHDELNATTALIAIEGNIVSDDLERFRQISLRYPKAVVVLSSDGGLIHPAIEIGKIIKVMGYATVVGDDDVCASACALIWVAGDRRLLSENGHVGFHASYSDSNGKAVESGVANALVGNYLTLLGLPAKAIIFATTAPPHSVLWLTTDNKEVAGIDFENITSNPQQATAPLQAPPQIQPAPPPPLSIASEKPLMFDDLPEYVPPSSGTPQTEISDDLLEQRQRYMPHGPAPKNWEGGLLPNQPWVVMFTSDDTIFFINQETFKPYLGNGWEFWAKSWYLDDNSKYSDSKFLFQINCDSISYRIISLVNYGESGTPIDWIDEDSYSLNKLGPIIPDTVGDGFYQAVCR